MVITRGVVYSAREAHMGPFISNGIRELSYIGETLLLKKGQYRGKIHKLWKPVETTRWAPKAINLAKDEDIVRHSE